ncbi:MAG: alpha/beta fold hydrolase [Novosphingobium sp.]|nr:alpha/beta fold hydrolase [Novosphingobium sp.]
MREFTCERDGARFAYRRFGEPSKPAVVLVHSIGLDGSMWQEQAEALAKDYQVVVPDLRGHGQSPVSSKQFSVEDLGQDVLAIMRHEQIPCACYVGCSLGANIGMYLGAFAPERLTSLVLANGPPTLAIPEGIVELLCAGAVNGRMAEIAFDMLSRWIAPPFRQTAEFQHLVSKMAGCPGEGVAMALRALAKADRTGDLAGIGVPTLVVAGSEDGTFDAHAAADLACQIPGARAVAILGAGHLPNLEKPAEFAQMVFKFLNNHQSAWPNSMQARTTWS